MTKDLLMSITLLLFLVVLVPIVPAQEMQKIPDHTEWLAKSLKDMQTIKVGMTRGDLHRIFTTEGGISNRQQRRYVYRECPHIKVDVQFEPVGKPLRDVLDRLTSDESEKDVIASISKPFLEWAILD